MSDATDLIKEIIEEQPKLAHRLFGIKKCDRIEVEHRFQINGAVRIADLAFFDGENQLPSCLVEIKYDDHKNPSNAAQLKDYLHYSQKFRCKFIYLTQHLPPEEDQACLQNGQLLLFSDIADRLIENKNSIERLLRRFFVDRGLVMHKFEQADYSHLRALLFRFFNPEMGQGRSHTKDAMSGGVGDAFGDLLRNMNIIAREVTGGVPRLSVPNVDFLADQYVVSQKIQNEARKSKKHSIATGKSKAGGWLWVYGRSTLSTKFDYLAVEFGLGLKVKPGYKQFDPFTYAEVYVNNDLGSKETYSGRPAGKRIIYDKKNAVAALRQRIGESVDKALIFPQAKKHRKKLSEFRDAVAQRKLA